LANSSSDEEKKVNKKASQGKDAQYKPTMPAGNYETIVGQAEYRKKGDYKPKGMRIHPCFGKSPQLQKTKVCV
jgi:hypothetical protein